MARPSGPGGCYTAGDIDEIEAELATKNAEWAVHTATHAYAMAAYYTHLAQAAGELSTAQQADIAADDAADAIQALTMELQDAEENECD